MEELSAIPVWLCIPFAGLLLSIAVMPLIKPDWWEKHQPLAVAFWSVLFIVPFAAKYGIILCNIDFFIFFKTKLCNIKSGYF